MNEKITDKDKLLHFGACLVASIISPTLAVGLAIGKEYGDYKAQGNHWCWLDILADAIGITIGTLVHASLLVTIL